MKRRWLALLGFVFGLNSGGLTGIAWSDQEYPLSLQDRIQELLRKDALTRMQQGLARYSEAERKPAAIQQMASSLPLNDATVAELTRYFQQYTGTLPKAEWHNGEIRIESGKNVISLSLDDYLESRIQVNGQPFSWNWSQPASENIARYEALWETKKSSSLFPSLVSEAHAADDRVLLKVAGLQIYFQVMNGPSQLESLDKQVVRLTHICRAPEPASGGDPLQRESIQWLQLSQAAGELSHIKNCDSLKTMAQKRSTQMPPDLCGHIDQLAKCMRETMGAPEPSVSQRKSPKKPSTSSGHDLESADEWVPKKADTAR